MKVYTNNYKITNNGFILTYKFATLSGSWILIRNSNFHHISNFYSDYPLPDSIVNYEDINNVNVHQLNIQPSRFKLLEDKCLIDLQNYHYHYDTNCLYKIPLSNYIYIKECRYDTSVYIKYYLLNYYLIKDCANLIIHNIITLMRLDYDQYQTIN